MSQYDRPSTRSQPVRSNPVRVVLSALLAVTVGAVTFVATASPSAAQSAAQDPAAPQADFNGDGKADIFWYAPGQATDHLWTRSGSGFASQPYAVNATYQPVTGDFDGDGRSDIFWYAPGPAIDHLWTATGSGGFTTRTFAVNNAYQPFTGDFTGDGRTDIFWYAPGSATDHLWTSTGDSFTSTSFAVNNAYEPFVGDFDGNGHSDIFWYRPGAASETIWAFDAGGFSSRPAPSVNSSYLPFVGDFNGDGRSDIFWYGPYTAGDSLWTSTGGAFTYTNFAVNGRYVALPGDFDGDGRSDILWYQPGAGTDYIWTSRGDTTFSSAAVGPVNATYQPIGGTDLPPPPVPVLAPARVGDRSTNVKRIQQKLLSLNYWVPSANGVYDAVTAQAVMAFQKYEGLGRDGVAGPATVARLARAKPAVAREGGNHVEISIAKQTLTIVRNGRTYVMNTSTGAPGFDTPRGRFAVNRQINGMRNAPLGNLWRPKYFNSGIAMHGSPSIPGHPASHGCARLHDTVINHIWDANLVPMGTPVWVY